MNIPRVIDVEENMARTGEHTGDQPGEPLVENGKGGKILAGRCIPEYAGWIPATVIGVDRQARIKVI